VRDDLRNLAVHAGNHHGVVSAHVAAAMGLDRRQLRRAEASGIIEFVHPDVLRFRGTVITPHLRVAAAVAQVPGCTASHESALWLHGVPRMPFVVAVTTSPTGCSSRWGIRIHRAGDLCAEHVTCIDGIRVTTLPRTVVDLASVFSRARLAHLIDHLTIVERRTSVAAIARVLQQVNRRGRPGIGVLRPLLDARSPGTVAPRSLLERRVDRFIGSSPVLPTPIAEHPLPADDLTGRVDRAWPDARLILEIDGRAWHAREQSMAKDRARDRAAAAAGWLTLRVLDAEVAADPDAVLRDIEAAYRSRVEPDERPGG
jgi:hypothetical protein